jgi:dolichyl-phosphate beta-glucosyltransferase
MPKPFLSVIIPVYNESKRITLTLIDVDRHLGGAGYSSEILVVNDGSTDNTVEVVSKFLPMVGNLRIVDNKENHGKGFAVRRGMLEAKGAYRLFMDADNSTSVDQVVKILAFFKEGYEVVIGSRDIKGAELVPPQPFYKRILGNVGNIIIQVLLLPGLWDTQCGFKCFSEEAAERVLRQVKINRWGFDVEALSIAKRMGYRIKEIPVRWVNSPDSKVKLSGYISSLWEVFKVRWWLWRKIYDFQS